MIIITMKTMIIISNKIGKINHKKKMKMISKMIIFKKNLKNKDFVY